ncbi:histone deacetylase family protein [Chelatococcus sp. GCM10030263]|uniref:histone deacetylase family protein n=1 Tax=Chelatococcus sp. GCM10030263 TaxID=3273387 RepID=UPI00360D7867
MTTLLISHSAFQGHAVPPGHAERPDRLVAIEDALAQERFTGLQRLSAPTASDDSLTLVHPAAFVAEIAARSPSEGIAQIDADTFMSPGSYEAALRAAGAAVLAVDEIARGQAANAFCAVRPPGHHAERATAMGFCFFNNAAVAARHAQRVHGLERVAILDWDVHHGNGTQDIFWDDASVLYCSTHQMPLYPGTGAASERGEHDTIINAPLAPGDGGEIFREALEVAIFPRISAFRPDLIIISAGFDAHWRDPLAGLNLTEEDFAWATREVLAIADRQCGGRVVSVLEGGYDLQGLALSAAAHVAALMEH